MIYFPRRAWVAERFGKIVVESEIEEIRTDYGHPFRVVAFGPDKNGFPSRMAALEFAHRSTREGIEFDD